MIGTTNATIGGNGAGSAALNVIAQASQPTVKENSIWVKTSAPMTSYVITNLPPTSPVQNMIWIKVANDSPYPINMSKDGIFMIYPINCYQYIDGVWVIRDAYSGVGTAWKQWDKYLYDGELGSTNAPCTSVSGGWTMRGVGWRGGNSYAPDSYGYDATEKGYRMYQYAYNTGWYWYTNNAIDVTNYSKIKFHLKEVSNGRQNNGVGLSADATFNTISSSKFARIVSLDGNVTGEQVIEVDVSDLSGSYYIGLRGSTANDGTYDVTVKSVALSASDAAPLILYSPISYKDGDWVSTNSYRHSSYTGYAPTTVTISKTNNLLHGSVPTGTGVYGTIKYKNSINVTNYSTIRFKIIKNNSHSSVYNYCGIIKADGSEPYYNTAAHMAPVPIANTSNNATDGFQYLEIIIDVDISAASGDYNIVYCLDGFAHNCQVDIVGIQLF